MTTLTRLRSLLAAATPGPWEFRATEHSGGIKFVVAPSAPRNDNGTEFIPADCSHGYNGRLIAAAVNALPALLRVAEAAKALEHEVWCDSLPRGTWVPVGCNCWQSSVWHELAALEGGTHECEHPMKDTL